MKKLRKVLAVVLAMAMVMGMSIVSLADATVPSSTTGTVTVKGVGEEGAIVTAYQLVTYDDKGQYTVVTAAADKGYTVGSRDADVVAELAKNTKGLNATELEKQENGDYTATLPAGTYLVLVTNSGSTIYNPMLVSLNVTYPDGVQAGEVNADGNYVVGNTKVYAKSTTNVPVDKIITDADGNKIGENGKYDDVYAGDTVYFELTGTIPSYSAEYTDATYTLKDTVGTGLTLDNSNDKLVEFIEAQLDKDAAVVTVSNNNIITIDFKTEYILKNANTTKKISIKYPATVNGNASNFNPATNKLEVTYSNNPTSTTTGTPAETKHYTFNLNNVLTKVDELDTETVLSGAKFELTSTNDSNKKFISTSDENGNIAFSGLDAGTYNLVETKAPAGYALSGKTYTVSINPTYINNELKSYVVEIKDGNKVIGSMTYTKENQKGSVAKIANTKLAELPSTGGIGTTIFTIVGCLLMIGAASILFVSRRRASK